MARNNMKKMSEKMKYLLDNIGYDKIIDQYEDAQTTEVTVKYCGDFLTYRLYVCSDGEWLITER